MSQQCPSCQRMLYNRRLSHCGFCGAAIPENLRFSPEEITSLNQKMTAVDEPRKLAGQAANLPKQKQAVAEPVTISHLQSRKGGYHQCPACERILYNRRLMRCGFCGEPIPESLRFTPEEIAVLDQEMAALAEAARKRELEKTAAEEEAARAGAAHADMTIPPMFM